MMKKITLLMLLISAITFSHATIIVRDIVDFAITSDQTLDFDFNNDGTVEFTFSNTGGTVGGFFNSEDVNFITFGTMDTGEGWDVIRPLTAGTSINSSGVFGALGDAYINPFWADAEQMFPNGDSYIGTTFKIGSSKHYGWILVHVNNDVITIKKYAYNNVANQGITAGQTTSISEQESNVNLSVYPNPTSDFVFIRNAELVKDISLYSITGQLMIQNMDFNEPISLQNYPAGIYLLTIETKAGVKRTEKIIKR
ncbi:MAG: T9SS type A sorting domain-containing protein [Bacteroidales bacterium]|jgi:hypothetical protein|nr:T9SS type A sorting domain-containing protein [Bacteroidales bacterium]